MFIGSALANTYPITFSCFFKPSSFANAQVVMAISSTTNVNTYYALGVNTSGNATCTADAAGTQQVATSSGTLTLGSVSHLCAVFQSATSRFIYLNNASNQSTTSLTPNAANLNRTSIGSFYNGSTSVALSVVSKGVISWGGIWKIDLPPSDVSSLFNNASPRLIQPANLLAYTRLVGTSPDMDLINAGGWTYSSAQTSGTNNLIFSP